MIWKCNLCGGLTKFLLCNVGRHKIPDNVNEELRQSYPPQKSINCKRCGARLLLELDKNSAEDYPEYFIREL